MRGFDYPPPLRYLVLALDRCRPQLFSGDARSRFKAEVDKRVRGYMEKGGSRRGPITGVRK